MTEKEHHECELCGNRATHVCSCEMCREVIDGELTDGRWLCDDCGKIGGDR